METNITRSGRCTDRLYRDVAMQSTGYFHKKFIFVDMQKVAVPLFLGLTFSVPVSNCVSIISQSFAAVH
jgi:hypothetical protein